MIFKIGMIESKRNGVDTQQRDDKNVYVEITLHKNIYRNTQQ